MKILQYVTDLWTMNITFYKKKLNPLRSLATGATYWCKKANNYCACVGHRNAGSPKLSWPMILARYFVHVWIGVSSPISPLPMTKLDRFPADGSKRLTTFITAWFTLKSAVAVVPSNQLRPLETSQKTIHYKSSEPHKSQEKDVALVAVPDWTGELCRED